MENVVIYINNYRKYTTTENYEMPDYTFSLGDKIQI
jgi:hypothetical protein